MDVQSLVYDVAHYLPRVALVVLFAWAAVMAGIFIHWFGRALWRQVRGDR